MPPTARRSPIADRFRAGEPPAAGVLSRDDVPESDTWNLADLYPDEERFLAARTEMTEQIAGLDAWAGRLSESPAILADALDRINEALKDLGRLYGFASMRSDTDTRVPGNQVARQEIELLWNDLSKKTSYVRPEILTMEPSRVEAFLDEEPRLAPHGQFLRNLIRQRAHVLSPPEERLMAEAGLITGAAPSLFNVFHDVELPRPEVRLSDGTEVRLTPAAFGRHRTTDRREDRELLFRRYFEAYGSFRETLGLNLYEAVKAHMFRARSRGYGSCLEAALDGDNIPVGVYRNLIEQVHHRLPVLHRYLGLRARALGLDRPGYHDLHCPLVGSLGKRFAPDDAEALVRRSMEPLGQEYGDVLEIGFRQRWIDWHPTPGKRSGAYAAGSAYDVHPYILMNFNHDYEGVSTLTHELGHALHSHFSNLNQPFPLADYSVFVAEVASTFNEALLNARMIEEATDDDERLFLVGTFLDQLRTTLFRQTMFAEFELSIHERAEAGEALSGEKLSSLYLDLLRKYHGHDAGVMEIPAIYGVEWASVPHFYYDFYVYQYATGIVAATALAEAVLQERDGARARYLDFLGSGGSDYPLVLLRRAGVDLESPDPYVRTIEAMVRALDRLEGLLDDLGR